MTVYTTDSIDKNVRSEEKMVKLDSILVHYFKNISNLLAWHNIFLPPGMFLKLLKKSKDFDVIHLQDYRFLPHIMVYFIAKTRKVPYVFQPRYAYNTFYQKALLKKIFDITFGHRLLRNASMIIAQMPTEAKEYENLGIEKEKIATIPNGLVIPESIELPERSLFRKKYGLNEDCKIILYLGRIDRVKGPDLLINAYADIIKSVKNTKLVIAGPDGGFKVFLEKLIVDLRIEDKVLFTGSLTGIDKYAAFVDADVYIMPSMHEGLSLAPLEAYACLTPIIVTDRCGTSEWMAKEFDKIIPYDKDCLSRAIIHVLNSRNLKTNLKREYEIRSNLLYERFSWKIIAENMENVYRKAIFGVH